MTTGKTSFIRLEDLSNLSFDSRSQLPYSGCARILERYRAADFQDPLSAADFSDSFVAVRAANGNCCACHYWLRNLGWAVLLGLFRSKSSNVVFQDVKLIKVVLSQDLSKPCEAPSSAQMKAGPCPKSMTVPGLTRQQQLQVGFNFYHSILYPSQMHSLIAAYFELVNTIVPGPQSLSYFISPALLVIGLLIPPHILSHNALAYLFMPVILVATIDAWRCMGGVDVVSVDTLWWCLLFLVLRDPKKDFKRVLQDEREEGYPEKGLWRRLTWVGMLLSERPLTCWKTGEKGHDRKVLRPYIQQSRERFIWSILRVLVPTLLALMPLALQLKANDPFFQTAGQPLSMPFAASCGALQAICLLQSLIPPEILRPATQGLYTYCLMIVLFLPPFLLPVVLTYLFASPTAHWSPHTWPRPHFGPISAVLDSGLRGLWGTWWHQQMRHAVSEPGRWIAKKLNLRQGGLARYASICISAFLLSGITHMGIVPPHPRWSGVFDAWNLRLKVAGFFWAQPLGILLEVKVVDPALRYIRWATLQRAVRVAWVLTFMSFAFVLLLDPFIELGCWRLWPPPITSRSVHGLLRGDWIL